MASAAHHANKVAEHKCKEKMQVIPEMQKIMNDQFARITEVTRKELHQLQSKITELTQTVEDQNWEISQREDEHREQQRTIAKLRKSLEALTYESSQRTIVGDAQHFRNELIDCKALLIVANGDNTDLRVQLSHLREELQGDNSDLRVQLSHMRGELQLYRQNSLD